LFNLKVNLEALQIFCEQVARQTPDGKWERVYSMADGSVEMQASDGGNFDAFE
jgi:hypothetical protein